MFFPVVELNFFIFRLSFLIYTKIQTKNFEKLTLKLKPKVIKNLTNFPSLKFYEF